MTQFIGVKVLVKLHYPERKAIILLSLNIMNIFLTHICKQQINSSIPLRYKTMLLQTVTM